MHERRSPFFIALLAALLLGTAAASPDSLRLEIRASPDAAYGTAAHLPSVSPDKLLSSAKREAAGAAPPLTDAYLLLQGETYRLGADGALWDAKRAERLRISRRTFNKLKLQAAALRVEHYGVLTDWRDAGRLVPRKSTFAITDVETGLTFRVQRRAGSDHADVQPLTKEDTRVMAQIYRDGWSWKRKAIVVTANGMRLAASMNGMPHGGDGIPGNGFSGHFCVHFLNSSTHRAEHPDPIHQLMVFKAAGKLRAYLDASSPDRLAQGFIDAMDHRDAEMLRMMTEGMELRRSEALIRETQAVASIRRTDRPGPEADAEGQLVYEVDRPVALTLARGGSRNETLRFLFSRPSVESPWRLVEVNRTADGGRRQKNG